VIQKQETTFDVVFEGHYVNGRDKAAAQAAFAQRFGDSAAGQIFSQKRAILKREVTRDAARRMQSVLADVGMVVSLAPADGAPPAPRKSGRAASMVERAAERARKARAVPTKANAPDRREHVGTISNDSARTAPQRAASPAPEPRTPVRKKRRWLRWIAVCSILLLPIAYVVITKPVWLPL
jgi:hypothetical protein